MDEQTESLISLIERLHTNTRQDGTPDWLHLKRTAVLLDTAFTYARETPGVEIRTTVHRAALGHDLLEDTDIPTSHIEEIAGSKALSIIQELTNTWGDENPGPYVEKMRHATEEARLIKLADLCDNIAHASYSSRSLGDAWIRRFFLPIVDPMFDALRNTSFQTYPKTADMLKSYGVLSRAHLEESVCVLPTK